MNINKLHFLSGTLRETKDPSYSYIDLLRAGLTALGVVYPSTSGGGGSWDSNGDMTDDRTVDMNNKTITFFNESANSNPSIEFYTQLTDNNVVNHWRVKSPTDDPFCPDFGLLSVVSQNSTAIPADPNSFNEVAKMGFNPDRFWEPTKNGFWDAWEPHWKSGDALYLERHISVDAAAFPGENRLYSILTILRNSWASSDIIHLWRGSSYNFKTTTGDDIMTMTGSAAAGFKQTMIGPGQCALIFELGGPLGNGVSMYTFDNGGVMDLVNNKWSRWYFRNTKINTEGYVYADNATALANGLSVGDEYVKPDGTKMRVMP